MALYDDIPTTAGYRRLRGPFPSDWFHFLIPAIRTLDRRADGTGAAV